MKKVFLLLIIGWMSVSTVGAQKPSAGLYYYNNECQVYPGQVATICLQVFNTSGGPYQITFQRNAEPPETKVDIPSSPFYWGEIIYQQTTFTLLSVKNRFGEKINIDPNNATITFKVYGTGVEEGVFSPLVDVYPNPARDLINISIATNDELEKIEIFNINGQLKKRISSSSASVVDVSDFPPGIYNMLLFTKTGKISSRRLIKQ